MGYYNISSVFHFYSTPSTEGVELTALEEVAMAVAGLQEMVLEAPGLEELAKEAPSLKELPYKLALDGFM